MLKRRRIEPGTIDAGRIRRRNLHCDILAKLGFSAGELDQHANLTAHMDIARDTTALGSVTRETTKRNLLADLSNSLQYDLRNLLAVQRAVIQRVHIGGVRVGNMLRQFVDNRVKLVRFRNEVRLAVNLDHRANLRVIADISSDRAFRRDTSCFLLSLRDALLAKIINRLLLVSVRLRQRLLAIHHAGARHLTELFYHCRCNLCHILSLFPTQRYEFIFTQRKGQGIMYVPYPSYPILLQRESRRRCPESHNQSRPDRSSCRQ